jgi:hypothetical protein
MFRNKLIFFVEEFLAPRPTPSLEDHPVVGSLRLLIQYIRNYSPYLQAVFSIRNLRVRHAAVTRDTLNMACITPFKIKNTG